MKTLLSATTSSLTLYSKAVDAGSTGVGQFPGKIQFGVADPDSFRQSQLYILGHGEISFKDELQTFDHSHCIY